MSLLTMIFPTSRIDAAIPEKLNPQEAEREEGEAQLVVLGQFGRTWA